MRSAGQIALANATRALTPAIAFLALLFAAEEIPGAGVAGGLLLGLGAIAYAIVFGAAAARRAFPPLAWRVIAGLALVGLIACACAPDWSYGRRFAEACLAAALAAALALAFTALAGRAPMLRDEEW